MNADQVNALFNKMTTRTRDRYGYTFRCSKGNWSVTAPDYDDAKKEAMHYFQQYLKDGEYDDQLTAPQESSVCRTFERAVDDMRHALSDRSQKEPYAAASSKLSKQAYACRNGKHPCDTVDVVQALIRAVIRADANGGLFPKGD